jgi:hypothetical protein
MRARYRDNAVSGRQPDHSEPRCGFGMPHYWDTQTSFVVTERKTGERVAVSHAIPGVAIIHNIRSLRALFPFAAYDITVSSHQLGGAA